MISTTIVKFITLKWGNKYGPEYVNRLFGSLLASYSGQFEFYCYTDNTTGLRKEIKTRDIDELRQIENNCFTLEKLFLFKGIDFQGPYCLLDIDILIQSNLFPYFEQYQFSEPRFAICARPHTDIDYVAAAPVFKDFGTNYVNSSFVTWKDDQLKWLYDFYVNNKQIIDYKYLDLDTFLFHCVLKKLKFHPREMVYSYNHERGYLPSEIVMFNTSHGRGVELHEGPEWVIRQWESYDDESIFSRQPNEPFVLQSSS